MLEDSQASLASMLTSKYIGPLKDEAASWAAKLLSVSEVIEQWLSVQNHWVHLESVFSLPTTKKDLPQEAKRFASIDRTWTKLMKKSYETKNVIQVWNVLGIELSVSESTIEPHGYCLTPLTALSSVLPRR